MIDCRPIHLFRFLVILTWVVLPVWPMVGCAPSPQQIVKTSTPAPSLTVQPSSTFTNTPTLTLIPTLTPSLTPSPSITPEPEPPGCRQPLEDYTRVEVNGWVINLRTLGMLEQAAAQYGGELEITGYHITQGSYHDNGAASFGTHLGGGAVDLSVMRRGTYTILWDDIEPLIKALRASGFAAWLRVYGELSPDSPVHIHAIAIGDRELSQAAQDQLTGPFGYFRGYSGVPVSNGIPVPDRHGGPVICRWMADLGYSDLRSP